jgi:chemotaxis protein MotB
MPKISPKSGDRPDADAWLLSYSDMITLVLGFFVIMLAISKVDPVKLAMISKSMNKAMDRSKVVQVSIDSLVKDIREIIVAENLQEMVDVNITAKGVTISAKGAILFPSGSAQLLDSALPMLDRFTDIISKNNYNIAVEGHTDNQPISEALARFYPTNWELSSARASSVVRYFIDGGLPAQRFSAAGYADTKPVATNDTEEGRANNRRVVIVFLVF